MKSTQIKQLVEEYRFELEQINRIRNDLAEREDELWDEFMGQVNELDRREERDPIRCFITRLDVFEGEE